MFAAMIIDKGMKQQIENWKDIRDFVITSFNKMEAEGGLPDLKPLEEA